MARIIKAIQLINPNADCSVEDDDIDKIFSSSDVIKEEDDIDDQVPF